MVMVKPVGVEQVNRAGDIEIRVPCILTVPGDVTNTSTGATDSAACNIHMVRTLPPGWSVG